MVEPTQYSKPMKYALGEVVCYSRKSTSEEGAGKSLEHQDECNLETCETFGLPISEEFLMREPKGMSGKLWWAGGGATGIDGDAIQEKKTRPVLTKIVQGIVAGRIKCVVVWSLDRLARHVGIIEAFIELMARCGCDIYDRNQKIDISTPEGRQSVRANAAAAAYARERVGVDASRGIRLSIKKGHLVGHSLRLGFKSLGKGKIQHVPEQQDLARRIFRLFVLGTPDHGPYSVYEIANLLTEEGAAWHTEIYDRRSLVSEGKPVVWPTTIYNVLLDPRYQGRQLYAKKEYECNEYLVDGQPVVPVWLYEAAQEKLKGNKRIRGTKNHSYGLSGLIRCGICGTTLVANRTCYKGEDGESRYLPAWTNKKQNTGAPESCDHKIPVLHVEAVDAYLDTHLAPLLLAEMQERNDAGERVMLANEKATIERELAQAIHLRDVELPRYIGKISPEMLGNREQEVVEEIAQLRARMRQVEMQLRGDSDLVDGVKQLPHLPDSARRDILRGILRWVAVVPYYLPDVYHRFPGDKRGRMKANPERGRLVVCTAWGSLHTAFIYHDQSKGVYPLSKLRPATLAESITSACALPDLDAFLKGVAHSYRCSRREFVASEVAPGLTSGEDTTLPEFNLDDE